MECELRFLRISPSLKRSRRADVDVGYILFILMWIFAHGVI